MILRVEKHTENYVIIDKTGLNEKALSWKAKGLLAYLLSKPNDWQVIVKHLCKQAPDGRDSVRSGLKELEDHGFITKRRTKNEKGQFAGVEYIVHEVPTTNGKSVYGSDRSKGRKEGVNGTSEQTSPQTENPEVAQIELNGENGQKSLFKANTSINGKSDTTKELDILRNDNTESTPDFSDFWDLYDKKVDKKKSRQKWNRLNKADKKAIMEFIPIYKNYEPDPTYRKDPKTFFNNRTWEDSEYIIEQVNQKQNGHHDKGTINHAEELDQRFSEGWNA